MNEKYARQMKKGVLDMLILKLLAQEPHYGYQLITKLKEQSSGIFSLKEGTLYPILYRLEDEKLIRSEWSGPEGKQLTRKYYALTDKGKAALLQITEIWKQISSGIHQIMD